MKKYLFALFGALFVLTACTPDKPGNDGNKTNEEEDDYITMYVASEKYVITEGFFAGRFYLVRFSENEEWTMTFSSIFQFNYEPGYEYELLVEKKINDDPYMADVPPWDYICRVVVNKEKKESTLPDRYRQ